jgi:hypothetical protein
MEPRTHLIVWNLPLVIKMDRLLDGALWPVIFKLGEVKLRLGKGGLRQLAGAFFVALALLVQYRRQLL